MHFYEAEKCPKKLKIDFAEHKSFLTAVIQILRISVAILGNVQTRRANFWGYFFTGNL